MNTLIVIRTCISVNNCLHLVVVENITFFVSVYLHIGFILTVHGVLQLPHAYVGKKYWTMT